MSKLDPLKCGNCGGGTFKLYFQNDKDHSGRFGGGPTAKGTMHTMGIKCDSISKIRPAPSAFDTDYEGTLCGGWGK